MSAEDDDEPAEPSLSASAKVVATAGWLVVVVGALGASGRITHFAGAIPWRSLALWMVGPAALHDLVIAPIITLIGIGLARLVPSLVRGPMAAGLIVSGALVAISWPRLGAYGALPDNSSILPGDAPADLLRVLAGVWVVVVGLVVARVIRARRTAAVS